MNAADGVQEGAEGFTPLGVVEEPVMWLPREDAREGAEVFGAADGFEVIVCRRIIERLELFARRAAPKEWYGLVTGRLCEDGRGRYAIVLGVVPDPDARTELASVETSTASEFRTRMAARLLYPDGVTLGWAHTHPRYGVRFSATDKRNQATWTQPHAVGIVADPWSRERIAVYRGPRSELLRSGAGEPEEKALPASVPTIPGPARRAVKMDHSSVVAVLVLAGCIAGACAASFLAITESRRTRAALIVAERNHDATGAAVRGLEDRLRDLSRQTDRDALRGDVIACISPPPVSTARVPVSPAPPVAEHNVPARPHHLSATRRPGNERPGRTRGHRVAIGASDGGLP